MRYVLFFEIRAEKVLGVSILVGLNDTNFKTVSYITRLNIQSECTKHLIENDAMFHHSNAQRQHIYFVVAAFVQKGTR